MEKLIQIFKGGAVKRYHTVTMIKEQTVAAHSWGVACVLIDILGEPSAKLLKAALYHDVAESMTGDVPATTKWKYTELAEALQKAEEDVERSLGIYVTGLTSSELSTLKFADMVDLILHCVKEYRLGNRDALEIITRGMNYLDDRVWSEECSAYFDHLQIYVKDQIK